MKSLVSLIMNNKYSINIRNLLNIKPVSLSIKNLNQISVSDAFLWRTDNGFNTVFKFTDILNLFYKIKNSFIEIHFYSKTNKKIKVINFKDLSLSNKIDINSQFLDYMHDYGVFYIYHFTNTEVPKDIIISNRCYTGYSKNNNLHSFIHGNTLAKYAKINNKNNLPNYNSNIVKKTVFQNQTYKIQKLFQDFDRSELFFSNPTNKKINFSVNEDIYALKNGCSLLIDISKYKTIAIKSNCLFLRPIVFSYKNEFLDVHHA